MTLFSLSMRRIHYRIKKFILYFIDLFYPPFKKIMPVQVFRYAACGAFNAFLNVFLYFLIYNYVMEDRVLRIGSITVSRHIAAYIIMFCLAFPVGFYLSMYVVFQGSYLRRRVQLIRYFIVTMSCVLINYLLLKLFVEQFSWNPTASMFVAICFIVIFSYVSQKYFSFRTNETKPEF